MILKLLLIIGVIAIVYFLFIKQKPQNINDASKTKQTPEVDEMVACHNCGVYVALKESIVSGSHYYCSQECLQKGK